MGPRKRELKLTVSRALSDEIDAKSEKFSFSKKELRQKEIKNANSR